MSLIEEGRIAAERVLEVATRRSGFYASGLPGGYLATWARDSMITGLGAATVGIRFQEPFKKSIETLSRNQSRLGQIPNAVGTYNTDRRSNVTFNSIDSTLWYIIGHHVYSIAYRNRLLMRKYIENIKRAFVWLTYQDPNEDTLIVQQPTMDWQDAFPHKYGRTINTQALYYSVLRIIGQHKKAEHLKKVVNGIQERYLSLYDAKLGYYLPWIWKNHDGEREQEHWFDTLGNVLAIITGLATPRIAESILRYIERVGINRPFPCKAIFPPIHPGDEEWHSYFKTSDARTPFHYLNGGIWPFIGGFYVAALVKMKKFSKAKRELELLALANKKVKGGLASTNPSADGEGWGFQEWLNGKTGRPVGNSNPYQAWSAGTYLYAYHCLRQKRLFYFKS